MKRMLIVTGAAGFIGCNLVRALNARGRTDILAVDHLGDPAKKKNLARLEYAEYVDKAEFRARLRAGKVPDAETVFHIGACSSTTEGSWDYLLDNNVNYTRDLCDWSLARGARFIYASSAATYGDGSLGYSDDDALVPELAPLNLYGRSKQEFDLHALRAGLLSRIAGLKYFNVYGPFEDHKGDMRSLVHKAYGQILETGEMTLFKSSRPEYRDGEQERDFVHVDDAVAATLFFHDHPEVSGLFNCGTGVARTWLSLARALFRAMGREERIRFVDMPASIRDKYQYHTRARMEKLRGAGFARPFLSIEEGVARYVREHLTLTRAE